ncbi:MAG: acetyl-CoA C-acyltransferase [Phycisphaerales bacterium]
MSQRVYIVAARRTPQGRLLGALSSYSAADLAVHAGTAALSGVSPDIVDRVIVGNVLGAGQKLNVARQVALRLNLPVHVPAFTVNMACASGMLAVSLADQAIRLGEAGVVLCGGTESMSNAPYLLPKARRGYKLGDGVLIDTALSDGLTDALCGEHMGITAERLAKEYGLGREAQDAFALRSQQRTARAMRGGVYADELVAVDKLDTDEHPRLDSTLDTLASLKPAFNPAGTVTAGNSSGINDGRGDAAFVAAAAAVEKHGLKPLAQIEASTEIGCDPKRMGLGLVYAIRRLVRQAGCSIDAFDTVELNEAFARRGACLHDRAEARARRRPRQPSRRPSHWATPSALAAARPVTHLAHQAPWALTGVHDSHGVRGRRMKQGGDCPPGRRVIASCGMNCHHLCAAQLPTGYSSHHRCRAVSKKTGNRPARPRAELYGRSRV